MLICGYAGKQKTFKVTFFKKDIAVKGECLFVFNLTGVCWTVCGLTYTTCSTVHIHSFHKKYIFLYTAFTLSYNRAVTGTSGCSGGAMKKTSSRAARPPQCVMYSVPISARSSCSTERTRLGYLAISLSSLLLSCPSVWFDGRSRWRRVHRLNRAGSSTHAELFPSEPPRRAGLFSC